PPHRNREPVGGRGASPRADRRAASGVPPRGARGRRAGRPRISHSGHIGARPPLAGVVQKSAQVQVLRRRTGPEAVNDRHQEGGAMAKNNKAGKKAKDLPIKSLAADQAKQVVGGTVREAGGGQQEYLVVKMNDIIITGVTPS